MSRAGRDFLCDTHWDDGHGRWRCVDRGCSVSGMYKTCTFKRLTNKCECLEESKDPILPGGYHPSKLKPTETLQYSQEPNPPFIPERQEDLRNLYYHQWLDYTSDERKKTLKRGIKPKTVHTAGDFRPLDSIFYPADTLKIWFAKFLNSTTPEERVMFFSRKAFPDYLMKMYKALCAKLLGREDILLSRGELLILDGINHNIWWDEAEEIIRLSKGGKKRRHKRWYYRNNGYGCSICGALRNNDRSSGGRPGGCFCTDCTNWADFCTAQGGGIGEGHDGCAMP